MALSKKWASIISVIASSVFTFIIVFQIPLFRVACRNKSCESPLEVISSRLIGSEVLPSSVVKSLLYPGAIAKSLIGGSGLPSYHNLFEFYSFHELNRASFSTDIRHLEVFAGSCLCLLGALLSLFKPTRISFIATLLIYWGLTTEILLLDSAHALTNSVRVYHPTLFLASLSAFLSIRSDVRKIIRCCRSKPFSKTL
ncbi:hypothetical protein EUTSA_v10019167mg [Eutrema salsugineum]|uniref:Uncharacterized protein n=1 Tax=Eutrema salsugineum TaxID=72664 RepID=V4KII9_EUTSA|nr:uncharacterized protein LOC18008204 [Eutrema salsugineum]ESQ27053.1 hypothetical protein EUTSA_v10019167mg [Eutrema salsugineum]